MEKTNAFVAILLVAASACGGAAVPRERAEAADSAWKSARTTGADGYPPADVHLKNAEKGIAQAKQLMKDGDNERADYVLQVAKAEADLAVSLTRENAAKLEADRKLEQVKALQQNQ